MLRCDRPATSTGFAGLGIFAWLTVSALLGVLGAHFGGRTWREAAERCIRGLAGILALPNRRSGAAAAAAKP